MPRQSGADHRALEIEAAHHYPDPAIFPTDEVFGRDATILEHEFGGLTAAISHFLQFLRNAEAGIVLFDDEGGYAMRAFFPIGLRVD